MKVHRAALRRTLARWSTRGMSSAFHAWHAATCRTKQRLQAMRRIVGRMVMRQGLPLVHLSAQPEPFLSVKPPKPLNASLK